MSKEAYQGQYQVEFYVDCLECMYGQCLIIFFINGYDVWIWDDIFYSVCLIFGFLIWEEL